MLAVTILLCDNVSMSSSHGIFMSIGHIEYASLNGTHIFKIIGEVRAQSCISLDNLLNKMDQNAQIIGAIVDLTEATFIDSTVLGILAKLGLKLKQNHNIQAVMLSTNPDITTLANSMGLNQVFVILNYCGNPHVCTKELVEDNITHSAMIKTVLDAHRTLMQLNENNQNMFEPLVKQLQKEQAYLQADHEDQKV